MRRAQRPGHSGRCPIVLLSQWTLPDTHAERLVCLSPRHLPCARQRRKEAGKHDSEHNPIQRAVMNHFVFDGIIKHQALSRLPASRLATNDELHPRRALQPQMDHPPVVGGATMSANVASGLQPGKCEQVQHVFWSHTEETGRWLPTPGSDWKLTQGHHTCVG